LLKRELGGPRWLRPSTSAERARGVVESKYQPMVVERWFKSGQRVIWEQ
jgi:hypothetical protein